MTSRRGTEEVVLGGDGYETVAASQTAQVLGSVGNVGDVISHLIITPDPDTGTVGVVTLLDDTTSIPIVASELTTGVPFTVALGLRSKNGAWKITTGGNVTVIAAGKFT